MYKKLLIAIFVICNILLSQVSFTDINAGLESGYGTAIWGDYGNDGYQDVLHFGAGDPINYLTYFTKLYRNDQNGGFEDITNHNLSNIYSTQGGAEWGDYDNDGDLDILLSGRTDDNNDISRIYRNDSGVFTDINAGLTGVSNGKVAWGDLDNDGDLDIVLTGKTTVQISKIYRNDSGIFTDIYAGLIGVEGGSVSLGDYDNDSDLDILLTGGTGSNYITKIYRNDTGLFTDINAGLPETDGSTSYHAEWGDYDNDGDLDILFSGQINMVYRNDNYDTFTDINVKLTYEWPSNGTCTVKIDKAEWGDCNNDGKLDILATGIGIPPHPSWSEFTAILINTGNDTFNDVYSNGNNNDGTDNTILSTRSGSASWCDYDKDGDLDFWINGIHTYEPYNYYCTAEIYKNNSSISNTSPTPPTNLYSSLNGNDVTLHWNTSTDAETPQNGLSYNLYIGTASGSCNILSPMSNTSNGYRKVSKRGNVDQINSWTIKDLPDGIYFYSVQAIDHVFAGSSFSPECIFVKGYTVLPENTSIVVGAGSEIRFFEGSETNCASNTILTIQDDGSLYSDGASITGDNADTWQGIVAEIGSSIILTHSVVKNAETGLYATAANVNVTFTSFESCQNGINLVNCNDLDSKSFMLYNNTFTGFGIGSGVSLTISDGTFSGNTIENFYSGVRFTLCSPTVTKNEIYDNRRFGIFIFGHNAFPQLVLNSKIGGRNNSIINNGSVNTSPSPFPFPDAQIGIMPFGNVYLTGGMNNIHSGQTNTTPQIPCISVSPRTIEIPPLQPTEILIEASSNYWGSEYVSNNFFSLAWNYIIDYTPWAIDPYTDEPGPPPSYSSNEPPSTESILLSNA
ncbi:MAG: VCBS repeat-containing protein, partial [Candidatus Delongbacteria bacterium]|nr:VCBS repeat-containing protein [Candidatus Delongbacteria bacterium]